MTKEKHMVETLKRELLRKGLKVGTEVPLKSKYVDIVAYDSEKGELFAIEVKIRNWNRAIQQALTYRFGAERVYIAMHKKYSHRVDLDSLDKFGIGLIVVDDEDVTEIVPPRKYPNVDPYLRDDIFSEVIQNA